MLLLTGGLPLVDLQVAYPLLLLRQALHRRRLFELHLEHDRVAHVVPML